MTKREWSPEILSWYACRHLQTLLDLDNLEAGERRLKGEIERLTGRRDEPRRETSILKSVRERIAEEVHNLKIVRNSISRTLNKEMKIPGNNHDIGLKQTLISTNRKIHRNSQEKHRKIKQEATKISIIAELIQRKLNCSLKRLNLCK